MRKYSGAYRIIALAQSEYERTLNNLGYCFETDNYLPFSQTMDWLMGK